MFKFRDREETLFYSFVYKDLEGKTVSELLKEARRKGAFSLPYHAVVLKMANLISCDHLKQSEVANFLIVLAAFIFLWTLNPKKSCPCYSGDA